MNIIAFLIIGLIAGWIASEIMEGHGLGALGDVIVGVIGAFVGGFVFNLFGYTAFGFWESVGMATIGAIVFLFVVNLLPGTRGPKPLGRM